MRSPIGRVHPLTPRVVKVVRAWFVAVTGIMACVALFFVVMGALEWNRAAASERWPTTNGIVTESRVAESTGGRRRGRSYTAKVEYAFQADGRELKGTRVSYRLQPTGHSGASERVAQYPVGASVTVHYDPADPSQSVLETGWDWWNAFPVGIGLFALGFCAVFLYLTFRITRRMLQAVRLPQA